MASKPTPIMSQMERKLQLEMQTSGRSKQILDNKEIMGAFAKYEEILLDALLSAPVKDDLVRFRYAEAIKVVKMVPHHLQKILENGKLAQADLDLLHGKKKRFF